MCNIVTEFYLYSIVYIYLINSRLDVTTSVCHHFCIELYQSPFAFFNQSHQMSPGTTPLPVLKELVLSLKMGYWILTNTGMGPYIQQGLCTAFTVASLGDLGGFSPCTGRALGEIKSQEATNTWHWQVREST